MPLKKESSPALFPHVICLHCQKSAMDNFSKVLSLVTWALVFFLLFFSSNTSGCHLLLSNLCFSAVWPRQAFSTSPRQSGALRQCTESHLVQFYWRWQFQAWNLREQRSAQLIFLCLGAWPWPLLQMFGALSIRCDQWDKILRSSS